MDDLTTNALVSQIGKTIYFMYHNRIMCGVVTGYDCHQLFISTQYSIRHTDNFFETEADLLDYLKKSAVDLVKMSDVSDNDAQ